MKGLRVCALLLFAVMGLTACLDRGGSEAAGSGEPSAPVIEQAESAQPAVAAQDVAVPSEIEQAEPAEASEEMTPEYSAIPLAGLTNRPLVDAGVRGSWIGLFGGESLGVIELAWDDGHRIDFMPDGQAIWSRLVNGVVVQTMDSQWTQDYDRLDLWYQADAALQSGIAELAPLGLASGEAPPGGPIQPPDDSFNPIQTALQVTRYPSYIVLTDRYGKMMVYGRLPESDPAVGAEGLAGYWTASINAKPDGYVKVGFSDGDMVLEHWNQGEFSGRFVEGYFVGSVTNGETTSYAVATYNENTSGNIHGIICEGPYYTTHAPFELIR